MSKTNTACLLCMTEHTKVQLDISQTCVTQRYVIWQHRQMESKENKGGGSNGGRVQGAQSRTQALQGCNRMQKL